MTILLVDSDKRALDREAQRLSRRQSGIVVVLHSSAADAEKFAMHHDVDIVYVREKLDEMSGQELVRRILRFRPTAECHVLGPEEDIPFAGASYTLIYPGDVGDSYPSYLYDLMTLEGTVVLDPVCASIRQAGWTDRQLETHRLPVWELTRGLPEGGSPAGELTALSALDGSWSTPFR